MNPGRLGPSTRAEGDDRPAATRSGRGVSSRTVALVAIALAFLLLPSPCPSAESSEQGGSKPASLAISGYGLLGNRELKRILRTLELGGKKPRLFTPDFVEDSALLLSARIRRDGYLEPTLLIELVTSNGEHIQVDAANLVENPLPRPLLIRSVAFKIHKGRLYFFRDLEFDGLRTLSEKQARSYFVETEILLNLKDSRVFTPERLRRGAANLTDALERQGFQEAKVEPRIHRNDTNGAVDVFIHVEQGPNFIIRSVQVEVSREGVPVPEESKTVFLKTPYSKVWLQDFTQALKTNQFIRGYPDTAVQTQVLGREDKGDHVEVDLSAVVKSGPLVRIGQVRFEGEETTRQSLMSRRVRIRSGEVLNRIKVEEGRYRLARLGIFETVDLEYPPQGPHVRDVLYSVREGKRLDLSLLLGYGSYELLRGGFEAEARNIWGQAHHLRLKVVQSFKSSSGETAYTIPEFVGNDVDLFFDASGLRRDEPSFLRVEYGGGFGVHKFFTSLATDASLRYSYQILNALETSIQEVASEGLTNPAVGSIILDIRHDRRDNPLYPRSGYKFFANVETASTCLGGEANYERLIASASWHHRLGGGRWISLGVSHGVDISFGTAAENLPFNKRFFPGGADSIRGYQEDEASPRNQQGQLVGAETYLLATIELEQAFTPHWSIVLFSDSLGFAHSIAAYPFDTGLFSVGAGLRWRSLIGPVRLEYGHNLNPRPGDPSGTLQFSLGFPF
jgi:outer membrane protein insertion porin family